MRRVAWIALVLLVLGSTLPLFAQQPAGVTDNSAVATPTDEYYELMKIFAESFEQIDRNYVKEVDRKQLVEAAIRGMMEKLDPYSNYITSEDLDKFNQDVEKEFGGIGIQVAIDQKTRRLTVMTPLPGTPAYRAGIRAGDQLMEIAGKSTEGFSLENAVELLKGKPGESVTIGILHPGAQKVEQISVTRELIHVASVLGDHYNPDASWNFFLDPEKKIGYIRLSSFSRNSAKEMEDALKQLQKDGMKALILDLRFNPGGLLSTATEICDQFIEDGKIVSTKGRNTEERVWNAKKPGTYSGFPMAVLVNRYSASASEILSACLQDHQRAKVIGERTWGKGSVQNVIEIDGGPGKEGKSNKSALKLTTAGYFRPSGKNIHRFPDSKESDEWGVMPDKDFGIDFTLEEMQKYLDFRRGRDVISAEGPPKSEFVDRQLNKAVEFVNSQLTAEPKAETKTEEKTEAKPEEKKAEEKKPAGEAGVRTPLVLPRAA